MWGRGLVWKGDEISGKEPVIHFLLPGDVGRRARKS